MLSLTIDQLSDLRALVDTVVEETKGEGDSLAFQAAICLSHRIADIELFQPRGD